MQHMSIAVIAPYIRLTRAIWDLSIYSPMPLIMSDKTPLVMSPSVVAIIINLGSFGWLEASLLLNVS